MLEKLPRGDGGACRFHYFRNPSRIRPRPPAANSQVIPECRRLPTAAYDGAPHKRKATSTFGSRPISSRRRTSTTVACQRRGGRANATAPIIRTRTTGAGVAPRSFLPRIPVRVRALVVQARRMIRHPPPRNPPPAGREVLPNAVAKTVAMTITVDDAEYAPDHLQGVTVSLTYQHSGGAGAEDHRVCRANDWWTTLPPEDDKRLCHRRI